MAKSLGARSQCCFCPTSAARLGFAFAPRDEAAVAETLRAYHCCCWQIGCRFAPTLRRQGICNCGEILLDRPAIVGRDTKGQTASAGAKVARMIEVGH